MPFAPDHATVASLLREYAGEGHLYFSGSIKKLHKDRLLPALEKHLCKRTDYATWFGRFGRREEVPELLFPAPKPEDVDRCLAAFFAPSWLDDRLKISVLLMLEPKGKSIAYRFEPRADGTSHAYGHVQFCRSLWLGEERHHPTTFNELLKRCRARREHRINTV